MVPAFPSLWFADRSRARLKKSVGGIPRCGATGRLRSSLGESDAGSAGRITGSNLQRPPLPLQLELGKAVSDGGFDGGDFFSAEVLGFLETVLGALEGGFDG